MKQQRPNGVLLIAIFKFLIFGKYFHVEVVYGFLLVWNPLDLRFLLESTSPFSRGLCVAQLLHLCQVTYYMSTDFLVSSTR